MNSPRRYLTGYVFGNVFSEGLARTESRPNCTTLLTLESSVRLSFQSVEVERPDLSALKPMIALIYKDLKIYYVPCVVVVKISC